MTHYLGVKFGTYLGQNANNKTMVNFHPGKKTDSKKGVMRTKVARTDTSTNDVSQIFLSDEVDILLTTFGPT